MCLFNWKELLLLMSIECRDSRLRGDKRLMLSLSLLFIIRLLALNWAGLKAAAWDSCLVAERAVALVRR